MGVARRIHAEGDRRARLGRKGARHRHVEDEGVGAVRGGGDRQGAGDIGNAGLRRVAGRCFVEVVQRDVDRRHVCRAVPQAELRIGAAGREQVGIGIAVGVADLREGRGQRIVEHLPAGAGRAGPGAERVGVAVVVGACRGVDGGVAVGRVPVPGLVEADRFLDRRVGRVGLAAPVAGVEARDEILGDVAPGVVGREGVEGLAGRRVALVRVDVERAGLGVDVLLQLGRGDADHAGRRGDAGHLHGREPEHVARLVVAHAVVGEARRHGRIAVLGGHAVEVGGEVDLVGNALELVDVGGPVGRDVGRIAGHVAAGQQGLAQLVQRRAAGTRAGARGEGIVFGTGRQVGLKRGIDIGGARIVAARHAAGRDLQGRPELDDAGDVGDIGGRVGDRGLDHVVAIVLGDRVLEIEAARLHDRAGVERGDAGSLGLLNDEIDRAGQEGAVALGEIELRVDRGDAVGDERDLRKLGRRCAVEGEGPGIDAVAGPAGRQVGLVGVAQRDVHYRVCHARFSATHRESIARTALIVRPISSALAVTIPDARRLPNNFAGCCRRQGQFRPWPKRRPRAGR